MKAVIALCLVALFAVVATAAPLTEQQYEFLFTRFVSTYNKQYQVADFFARYNVFKNNLDMILAHNSKGLSWTMAMNEFGDLTGAEFEAKYTGAKPLNNFYARSFNTGNLSKVKVNGGELDWAKKGAVNPVKNQGQCGSCWAFAAVASIEGAWQIAGHGLEDLSEQQLVDCAGSTGNYGCQGGWMSSAFEWVISNGGICRTADYPYTARDQTCKKTCKSVAKLSGYKEVPTMNEAALFDAVNTVPVTIAIQADQPSFQFYSGGVMDGGCGTRLNHGVTVTGYGTLDGKDYWRVRNSWGTNWGVDGYILMVRNKNQCGLAQVPSYATA